jgi:hypothetical protein
MSTTRNTPNGDRHARTRHAVQATRGSVGTLELVAYFGSVIGVFLASALMGSRGSEAVEAWFFVALLAFGYALSRAGSPTPAAATGTGAQLHR